ncbi:hypothetical protein RQP46_005450 [Phenoliferia psychrophenolica]
MTETFEGGLFKSATFLLFISSVVRHAGAAKVAPGSALDVASRSALLAGSAASKRATPINCLDSTANDTTINLLFYYGATVVNLCPNAVIPLYNTIFFTQANQVLTTLGNPTDSTRATIRPADIICQSYNTPGITISSIQIDGNRPGFGIAPSNINYALMEIGGNSQNQVVKNVRAFEPRGWEGTGLICRNATIINNQIGPSGHAPSGAQQFRRRDSTGSYSPGQWADGISHACAGSLISGNTITDGRLVAAGLKDVAYKFTTATDGAIVIFGAPGTKITGNTIVANDRQLLGAINLVDYWPTYGDFTGVSVSANTIISQASMIKIGIAIGTQSITNYNATWFRNFGGTVSNNVLKSGSTGYFGFGLSIAGQNGTTISGTSFSNANFGYVQYACDPNLPPPGPMIKNPYTTPLTVSSAKFSSSAWDFALW